MDTAFTKSKSSKTSEPHVSKFKLTDKLDLRRCKKVLLYKILVFSTH